MVFLHYLGNISLNRVENDHCKVQTPMHIFLIHRHKKQLKSTYSKKEVQVLCCYIFYKEINHNTICFMIRM